MKQFPHVLGMSVLGLVMLSGMAALVEWRMGRPVKADGPEVVVAPDALARLAEGLRTSMEVAVRALEADRRSEAMHALDGALRAAEVGAHATAGAAPDAPFHDALRVVRNARRAVQNGNPPRALELLRQGLARFDPAAAIPPARPPADLGPYDGANVIDAHDVRVGEVTGFRIGPDGRPEVALALRGNFNVFGVIDLGGREVAFPPDRLVFGPRRTLGATMVAVPALRRPGAPTRAPEARRCPADGGHRARDAAGPGGPWRPHSSS